MGSLFYPIKHLTTHTAQSEERARKNRVDSAKKFRKRPHKFFCEICNQGFTTRQNMLKHFHRHSHKNPFGPLSKNRKCEAEIKTEKVEEDQAAESGNDSFRNDPIPLPTSEEETLEILVKQEYLEE